MPSPFSEKARWLAATLRVLQKFGMTYKLTDIPIFSCQISFLPKHASYKTSVFSTRMVEAGRRCEAPYMQVDPAPEYLHAGDELEAWLWRERLSLMSQRVGREP